MKSYVFPLSPLSCILCLFTPVPKSLYSVLFFFPLLLWSVTAQAGDSDISVAPVAPANKRLLVVAKDGTGTHQTIQAAADASLPGDTIQVKNGVFSEYVTITKSGTQTLPITFMAYPGQRPVVRSGFRLAARWIIIDGFEITQTHTGIHITGIYGPTAGNSTIRNNWIHDNGFMGIFTNSAPDLLIENNTLERNGLGPGNCTDAQWGGAELLALSRDLHRQLHLVYRRHG